MFLAWHVRRLSIIDHLREIAWTVGINFTFDPYDYFSSKMPVEHRWVSGRDGFAIDPYTAAFTVEDDKEHTNIWVLHNVAQCSIHRVSIIFRIFKRIWPDNLNKARIA